MWKHKGTGLEKLKGSRVDFVSYDYQDYGNDVQWFLSDITYIVDDDDRLHCSYGPARVTATGTQMWYKHGKKHRRTGPAIIYKNGRQEWWRDGQLHRDGDNPALIIPSDRNEWWVNGNLHRIGGPASKSNNGDEEWCVHGNHHRDNGPAIYRYIGPNHTPITRWIINGVHLDSIAIDNWVKENNFTIPLVGDEYTQFALRWL